MNDKTKEYLNRVDEVIQCGKYKDFIPMFTADKFNPSEWVKLFKAAGAQYVMPVAEAKPYTWQSDTSVAKNSWCYTEGNESPRRIFVLPLQTGVYMLLALI